MYLHLLSLNNNVNFLFLNSTFFFVVVNKELSFLRDEKLELEIRNELLREKVDSLQSSLNNLDRKYRRLVVEHSKCSVKHFFLHR